MLIVSSKQYGAYEYLFIEIVHIAIIICAFHGPAIRKTTRSDTRHGARTGFRLVYRMTNPNISVSIHSNAAASTVYFIARTSDQSKRTCVLLREAPRPRRRSAGTSCPAQAIQFPRSMSESPGVTLNFHRKTTRSRTDRCVPVTAPAGLSIASYHGICLVVFAPCFNLTST